MTAPDVRLRIDLSPACSIGPGKIALLEAIAEAGSLIGAAPASHRTRGALLVRGDAGGQP